MKNDFLAANATRVPSNKKILLDSPIDIIASIERRAAPFLRAKDGRAVSLEAFIWRGEKTSQDEAKYPCKKTLRPLPH